MDNWQLALVVIAALFAGATIPMLMQARSTLASVDRLVRANERDVRRTVAQLAELTHHMNQLGREVGGNTKHVKSLVETVVNVTDSVRNVGGSFRMASVLAAAIGPAISAAIRALQGDAARAMTEVREQALEELAEHEHDHRANGHEATDGAAWTTAEPSDQPR